MNNLGSIIFCIIAILVLLVFNSWSTFEYKLCFSLVFIIGVIFVPGEPETKKIIIITFLVALICACVIEKFVKLAIIIVLITLIGNVAFFMAPDEFNNMKILNYLKDNHREQLQKGYEGYTKKRDEIIDIAISKEDIEAAIIRIKGKFNSVERSNEINESDNEIDKIIKELNKEIAKLNEKDMEKP